MSEKLNDRHPGGTSGAFGTTLARHLRQAAAPTALTRTDRGNLLAATLVRTDGTAMTETTPLEPEASFHIILQLRDLPSHELWSTGRLIRTEPYPRDSVSIIDLRERAYTRMQATHAALVFYMPQPALDEIAADYGTARIEALSPRPGVAHLDPVMARIGEQLLPLLHCDSRPPSRLLTDYLLLVAQAHVVQAFGTAQTLRASLRGGLAPGQERRVKEMMRESVDRTVSLAELARECSLSVSHFTRAFRTSTGVPPHRWLTQQRVDAAKSLLLMNDITIAQVAQECGYAEQSSFTRAFTRVVGTTPAAWRRAMAT